MGRCHCDCDDDDDQGVSDAGAVYNVAMTLRNEARLLPPDTALYRKLRDWSDDILLALPEEYQPAAMQRKALAQHRANVAMRERARLAATAAARAQLELDATLGINLLDIGWRPLEGFSRVPRP